MRAATLSLLFASLLSSRAAFAQPANEEQSRNAQSLYAFAKKSFRAGQYGGAVRALEECYRITKEPKYLYSIGQASERAYWSMKKEARREEDLRVTVERYRQYLKDASDKELDAPTVVEGKVGPTHRAVANEALARLEPLLPKEEPAAPPPAPAAPAEAKTGLLISSSTPGARIELDGKVASEGLLSADTEPGPHRIRVMAPGFVAVEREVRVEKGALLGLDISLEAKPSVLAIEGPSGADVSIDGVPKGTLPLPRPLAVPAGDRLIVVTRRGSHPMVEWKKVDRGERYAIHASLPSTAQRYSAYATFAVAGGAAVVGAVLTGLAFEKQSEAADILQPIQEQGGSVTTSDVERFDEAIASRDLLRTGAAVGWGLCAAGLTSGIFLFVFDEPSVQAPPSPREGSPDSPSSPELVFTPIAGPAFAGLTFSMRY